MNKISNKLSIEICGGSHEPSIGALVDGFNAGTEINLTKLKEFTNRRKSFGQPWATPRIENDEFKIIHGGAIKGDKLILDGSYLKIEIENNNVNSGDYNNIKACPRPSHADYVAYLRDGVIPSGGGRFSGRMTAPICVIGGIAKQILEGKGININAYISKVGRFDLGSYKKGDVYDPTINTKYNLPLIDRESEEDVVDYIMQASKNEDSLGGIIECVIEGVEPGSIGDALFDSIESKIAYMITSIPAVRGIEFGLGFDIVKLPGSIANDPLRYVNDKVKIITNKSGGINGGIANGNPITFATAFRPTPSISQAQQTVDLAKGINAVLEVRGRHDACILPRAVPVVEACAALAILADMLDRE